MRVLHLWKNDFLGGGGGAIAMFRLHSKLREAGIDSWIMCQRKSTDSPFVKVVPPPHRIERRIRFFTSRLGLNDIHRLSSFKIKQQEVYKKADIIHFHGTHSGFINYLSLPALVKNKPAVFTLHDMWCLTGHCGYSYDCERFKTGCGKCPYPDEHPRIRRDGTKWEWKLKNRVFNKSHFTILCPSAWMANQAKQSILSHYPIRQMPCAVNTGDYQPLDPELCRTLLGIELHKKVLMISSIKLTDYRKGADLLIRALEGIPKSLKSEIILIVLGQQGAAVADSTDIQTIDLGYVSSDRIKAIAFSAADLLVLPTRADNFPLVSLESIACGTPVVAFRVGGVPEQVRPEITGYLAEPENEADLQAGILRLLEDNSLRAFMSEQCRKIVLEEYDLDLHTKRHIDLYSQMLENKTP
jgi:glycosyltransferase involved in cell wall biosynthesis